MADEGAPRNLLDAAHDGHDREHIAALLDRDLPEADRAIGIALTESCADCQDLLSDLRALAAATLELPVPARPRDFALSPAAVTRLRAVPPGEPMVAGARLEGEMTHSAAKHETHDRLLIANLVDRSISAPERARAEAQLAACLACAQLHDELVAIATATRALPTPARTRDFTLTAADAARLRGSGWRRLIAAIGSTRDVFSRPLAIGFTTLGLAGLLVATVPMPFGTGGATSAERLSTVGAEVEDGNTGAGSGDNFAAQASPAPPQPDTSGPAIAAAGPSSAPSAASEAAPAASPDELAPDVLFEGGESSPLPGEPAADRSLYQADLDGEGFAPSPMFIAAGLMLLVGLGLFGLRWTARRLGDG